MKKIVIVDDDENLIRLLLAGFEAKNYEVHPLMNGKEAKAYLSNESNARSIDLLILDRMLPDMDGTEILRFFREKYGKKTPILFLSILSSEKDILEGLSKGAVDYVSKPFSMKVLIEKAEKLIQK